jgi:hypothetical protein
MGKRDLTPPEPRAEVLRLMAATRIENRLGRSKKEAELWARAAALCAEMVETLRGEAADVKE